MLSTSSCNQLQLRLLRQIDTHHLGLSAAVCSIHPSLWNLRLYRANIVFRPRMLGPGSHEDKSRREM